MTINTILIGALALAALLAAYCVLVDGVISVCRMVKMTRNKRKAKRDMASWLDSSCLILDTETTGLGDDAEIVEISVIDSNGVALIDTLVKPTKTIPVEASNVHGITDDMVAQAPTWAEVYPALIEAIRGRKVVIFNAQYDVRIINQTSDLFGLPRPQMDTGCAMLAYADFFGEWDKKRSKAKWQSLEKAGKQQCVSRKGNAHRALSDCLLTLDVMKAVTKY